jgi:hypothetical protein
MNHSKTKTSFYRRLYVAYLIDQGINTVPAIIERTGMPLRTAQDTIAALSEIKITCEYVGALRNGNYVIKDWGFINKESVKKDLKHVKGVLMYP